MKDRATQLLIKYKNGALVTQCNPPIFRWNVIATRACCLSGRHLSIVGDEEAAFIEVRRAKTISRPDLFCTAGIPAGERWQSSLQVRHDLNSLSIGQSSHYPTIQPNVPARSLNLPPRSPLANGGPAWCTWCQPHVSCLTLSCPIVQRD